MVALSGLTNCCGAQILYGFPNGVKATDSTYVEIVQLIQGKGAGTGNARDYGGNVMTIIALNDSQCVLNPKMLEILAGLGFALVGRSNNGLHNSWVNLFVRCEMQGRPFKKLPFKYPGVNSITATEHPPKMARVPVKPDALPDPFKPDGGVEWDYKINVEVKA